MAMTEGALIALRGRAGLRSACMAATSPRRWSARRSCWRFAVLALALISAAAAQAGSIANVMVTKTADTNDGVCDADCSLREAIATAAGGDTIGFDAALAGTTIHLGDELMLLQQVIIDGSSLTSRIAISGDSDQNGSADLRVFHIANGAVATLKGLIITRGRGGNGGGLLNDGTATIIDCVFSANVADFFGGAIRSTAASTLTITGSTVADNSAFDGGGIFSSSQLTVTASTFSGNSVPTNIGGAIFSEGPMTITNSTFSGNSANFGGAIYSTASQTIRNSTFSGNIALFGGNSGAGIFQDSGTLTYANTIIANSIGGDCISISPIGGSTGNLVEDGGCGATLFGDPRLGSFGFHGGTTQTFEPGSNSAAVDAGDDTICNDAPVNGIDQLGMSRAVGAHCDIGAYESLLGNHFE
jgi:CSLREA domain-containing protein